ncbi:MAG: aquaporin, partial [Chitinophagaceae bacterium]|nr:aquaporin [Anaerolineae bacterium]
MNALLKPSLAEFLGTFTLVFIGGLAGSVTNQTGSLLPAIAHGFILVAIIYSYGHISGAHVNPAVTAGLLVGGKVKIDRAIAYWIAQFAGAIVAAIVMSIILPPASLSPDYVGGAAAAQTKGSLTDTAVWSAALLEFFLTGLLVTTVYQTAVYEKVGNLAGLAIGFLHGLLITFFQLPSFIVTLA